MPVSGFHFEVFGRASLPRPLWRPAPAKMAAALAPMAASPAPMVACTSKDAALRHPQAPSAVGPGWFPPRVPLPWVQGVWFRAYTQRKARELGLVGWCENTERQTVEGEVQGPRDACEAMRQWLAEVGSPLSRIDKLEVADENHDLPSVTFTSFDVVRRKGTLMMVKHYN